MIIPMPDTSGGYSQRGHPPDVSGFYASVSGGTVCQSQEDIYDLWVPVG